MEKMNGLMGIRDLMENTIPATVVGASDTANMGAAADSSLLVVKAERLHGWSLRLTERVELYPHHPELWRRAFVRAQRLRVEIEAMTRRGAYEPSAEDATEYADEYMAQLAPWAWARYTPGLSVPWWRWSVPVSSLKGR